MRNVEEYIQSGIIELYVFGLASAEEMSEVEDMAASHERVRSAIETVSNNLEEFAQTNAIEPPADLKPLLIATIDYIKRMENGETPSFPPLLHEGSAIADYACWINRPDMIPPSCFTDLFAKIIGYTPQVTTAIVWVKKSSQAEVHDDEHEKFLILEGTCDVIVEDDIYHLAPGDFFSIPLYKEHIIKVTSDIPCKVILQRVAA